MNAWHCTECKSPLISTPSGGSVCPNGHGRIGPKMPSGVRQVNECLVAGVPLAKVSGEFVELDGARYRPGRKQTGSDTRIVEAMRGGKLVAVVDGEVRELLPL